MEDTTFVEPTRSNQNVASTNTKRLTIQYVTYICSALVFSYFSLNVVEMVTVVCFVNHIVLNNAVGCLILWYKPKQSGGGSLIACLLIEKL